MNTRSAQATSLVAPKPPRFKPTFGPCLLANHPVNEYFQESPKTPPNTLLARGSRLTDFFRTLPLIVSLVPNRMSASRSRWPRTNRDRDHIGACRTGPGTDEIETAGRRTRADPGERRRGTGRRPGDGGRKIGTAGGPAACPRTVGGDPPRGAGTRQTTASRSALVRLREAQRGAAPSALSADAAERHVQSHSVGHSRDRHGLG